LFVDGKLLPLTRLQSVSADGVLTIRNVQKSDGSGNYICTAKYKEYSSSQTVKINVVGEWEGFAFFILACLGEG
jgi:hypothetical protein